MHFIKLLHYFLISPIFEWGFHYLLHKTENRFHNRHHEIVYLNKYEKINKLQKVELWPLICIVICYKLNYIFFLVTFLRYWICHTYINFTSNKKNYLVKHHYEHHKYKKYNLCVSAIWPDYFFDTKFIEKKSN